MGRPAQREQDARPPWWRMGPKYEELVQEAGYIADLLDGQVLARSSLGGLLLARLRVLGSGRVHVRACCANPGPARAQGPERRERDGSQRGALRGVGRGRGPNCWTAAAQAKWSSAGLAVTSTVTRQPEQLQFQRLAA